MFDLKINNFTVFSNSASSFPVQYSNGTTYHSFGECGLSQQEIDNLPTDKLFTGQRLDSTGLYYYNARYYDPGIGKFISPDSIIPNYYNPQFLNRYSYCLNNPLKYTDSTGHFLDWIFDAASIVFDIGQLIADPSWVNGGYLAADVILGIVPFVPAGVGPAAKVVKGVSNVLEGASKVAKTIDKSYYAAKLVNKAEGFKTFNQLKKAVSTKDDEVIHHIVEQCQMNKNRAGFDPELIQNPRNALPMSKADNQRLADYYSSKQAWANNMIVRDYVSTLNYEEQYQKGMEIINILGIIQ